MKLTVLLPLLLSAWLQLDCGVLCQSSSSGDISFELPDLTVNLKTLDGSFQLRAYRSIKSTSILEEIKGGNTRRVSELRWVSVGRPIPVLTQSISDPDENKLFHWSRNGFHVYFQMLTDAHIRLLAKAASFKYRINVTDAQINHLILSSFECSISLRDEYGKRNLLKGAVGNFASFPLKMSFSAPLQSVERNRMRSHLELNNDTPDIEMMCTMASSGKKTVTNSLSISSQRIDELGLTESLFGPSSTGGDGGVYVTRDQMAKLSRDLYSSLNIIEEYDMPESQFSQAFVGDFIKQTADSSFRFIPVNQALQTLSKYTLDFSSDLTPDVIERDLGSILKVEKYNNRNRIVVSNEHVRKEEDGYKVNLGASADVISGIAGPAIEWGIENTESTETQDRSVTDQLRELNTVNKNEIKWQIEGTKVVPKSLSVARLLRGNFKKTLTFGRVRIFKLDAPFKETFSINTVRAKASTPALDQLNTRVAGLDSRLDELSDGVDSSTNNLNRRLNDLSVRSNADVSDLSKQLKTLKTQHNQLNVKVSKLSDQLKDLSRRSLKRCRICRVYKPLFSKTKTDCTPWVSSYSSRTISLKGKLKIECRP